MAVGTWYFRNRWVKPLRALRDEETGSLRGGFSVLQKYGVPVR